MTLTQLADRVSRLTGPCSETDLAIHLALYPNGKIAGLMQFPRGFDGHEGTTWQKDQNRVCYETRNEQGNCYSSGGHLLPAVTGSLDAAMTLAVDGYYIIAIHQMPNGWIVKIGSRSNDQEPVIDEEHASLTHALCSAWLLARAASESSHG